MTIWTNPPPPYDGTLTVWANPLLKRHMIFERSLSIINLRLSITAPDLGFSYAYEKIYMQAMSHHQ